MATTLSLLNNVLRGLRKDTIDEAATEVTAAYHLLALQFLNSAKRMVESAWDWQALRTTVTVTLSQGTVDYALTAAGPADVDVGPRSRLLYENPVFVDHETSVRVAGALPQVFDVTSASEYRLREAPWERLERLQFTDGDEQGEPTEFALRRTASGITLKVHPIPSGSRTIKMRFVIPQDDLSEDDIDSTTLTIPADEAVWGYALVKANRERGEELSRPLDDVVRDADTALADSVSLERTDADDTGYPE